jgi:hypothetical protein
MKKITFTVKLPVDPDDADNKQTKEQTLEVITPNLTMVQEAQLEYNKAFDKALRSKAPLRIEVERLLKDRGIWTEVKQAELDKLNDELVTLERKLKAGGMKLKEARDLALEIRAKRDEINNLSIDRRILVNVFLRKRVGTMLLYILNNLIRIMRKSVPVSLVSYNMG